MLGGDDTLSDETVESVHMVEEEVKDTDCVVIAQPAPDGPDAVVVSSVKNPTTIEGLSAMNPGPLDAPSS